MILDWELWFFWAFSLQSALRESYFVPFTGIKENGTMWRELGLKGSWFPIAAWPGHRKVNYSNHWGGSTRWYAVALKHHLVMFINVVFSMGGQWRLICTEEKLLGKVTNTQFSCLWTWPGWCSVEDMHAGIIEVFLLSPGLELFHDKYPRTAVLIFNWMLLFMTTKSLKQLFFMPMTMIKIFLFSSNICTWPIINFSCVKLLQILKKSGNSIKQRLVRMISLNYHDNIYSSYYKVQV